MSDTLVKFGIHPDKSTNTSNRDNCQKLLSGHTIGICNEDISILDHPMGTKIGANNQLDLLISTGVLRRHRHSICLWYKKSSWEWLCIGWDQTGLRQKLLGMMWTQLLHISGGFVKPVLPHPLVVSGALGFPINGSILPQIYGTLMNLALPLIEISLVNQL